MGLSERVEPSNGQLLDIPAIVESEVSEIEPCPHYPIFLGSDGNLKSNYSYLQVREDKGVMEDFFFDFCNSKLSIPPRNLLQIQIGGNSITPDIAVVDEDKGVRIAIEIDEPYTLNNHGSLIPIHFKGCDEQREKTLLENGWSIIRFAEEQIAKEPEKCVQFIINCMEGVSDAGVTKVERWSLEDANSMIDDKYRNSYLPVVFSDDNIDIKSKFSFRSLQIRNLNTDGFEKNGVNYEVLYFQRHVGEGENKVFDTSMPEICYIPEDIFWDKLFASDYGRIIEKYGFQDTLRERKTKRWLVNYPKFNCLYLRAFGVKNKQFFNLKDTTKFEIYCTEEGLEYYDNYWKRMREEMTKSKKSM